MTQCLEERPYTWGNRVSTMGKSSVTAECPFCHGAAVIFLWSIASNGKKRCTCGAVLHVDRIARKLVRPTAPDLACKDRT